MMNLFPKIENHQANPVTQEEVEKSSLVGKRIRVKASCWAQEATGIIEVDRGWPVGFVEVRADEGEPPPKVRICPSIEDYEILEGGQA